jgi:hypothetical protein
MNAIMNFRILLTPENSWTNLGALTLQEEQIVYPDPLYCPSVRKTSSRKESCVDYTYTLFSSKVKYVISLNLIRHHAMMA